MIHGTDAGRKVLDAAGRIATQETPVSDKQPYRHLLVYRVTSCGSAAAVGELVCAYSEAEAREKLKRQLGVKRLPPKTVLELLSREV